jgi:hypothetical protein
MTNASDVEAMAIAYDCFDRTTSALVARSAIDMTSPAVSCLPVPSAAASDPVIEADNSAVDADIPDEEYDDSDITDEDLSANEDIDFEEESLEELSTGEALTDAAGQHIGKLIGNMIGDIFR